MGGEWKETILGNVIVTNDATYSKKDKWEFINYLDTGNITENQISELQYLVVGKDKIPSRAKRKIKAGDIVYSTVRPNQKHYGILRSPIQNLLVSTGFTTIRAKQDTDTDYIYWFLVQPQIIENLQTIGEHSTSAYPSIKPSDIERLVLNLAPLPEQKAIAHILGSLDDKIELNRRMNETLEAMAQALFKSWFVDFDPVIDNALAAGNKIPDALKVRAATRQALGDARKPLPDEIRRLFPASFEYHEDMGWVPEGWKVELSGKVIDVRDGTHDSPKQSESGFPLVTSKHITSGTLNLNDTYLISEIDFEKVNQRSKVEHGDILLTMIGTVGIPYLVMQRNVDFAIKNIGLFRTSKSPLYRYFFFLLLQSRNMQNYLNARMAGTTQKYLSLKVLRNIEFICPSEKLLSSFNDLVSPLMIKRMELSKENNLLTNNRDTLLPKLLSGQIRILDAEKRVQETL